MKLVQFAFVHLLVAVIYLGVSIRAHSTLFRGISPEDEKHYMSGEVIKCKDGSKTFLKSQLNDDFCDCLDSTDEPGTSACPLGKFFCPNAGHFPVLLYSSRVNDGICDCCDGTDEYDGIKKCPNTCWEAGKAARDEFKKTIETYRDGISLRENDIQHAKAAFLKDEADLLKLQNEEKMIKDAVAKLKEHKELIEKAEEEEKERMKKEEGEKKETEQNVAEEKVEADEDAEDHFDNASVGVHDDKIGLTDDALPPYQEETEPHENSAVEVRTHDSEIVSSRVSQPYLQDDDRDDDDDAVPVDPESENQSRETQEQASHEKDAAVESLSKEDLGRIVASRWTGKKTEEQPPESDEEIGYASDTDDDHDDHGGIDDDSREEDEPAENHVADSVSSDPSWLEKIQRSAHNLLRAVIPFKQPVNISDADRIRKDYDESSSKLSKLQSKISKLKNKLSHDFGDNREFYSFHGRCFEAKEAKYTYKICPFEDASQLEGHSTTLLGKWEKFENSYGGMLFSNGDRCWNGPDRSLRVRLRCGLNNEVLDIDEPSRCEYTAVLSTPAVCVAEKLKDLQHKLEQMNEERLKSRDEL